MNLQKSHGSAAETTVPAQQGSASSAIASDEAFLANLGRRVLAKRAEVDITQIELALSAGVSRRHLHDLEKGRQNVSVLILRRLSVALNTSPEQLLKAEET